MNAISKSKPYFQSIAKAGLLALGLGFSTSVFAENLALSVADQGNQSVQTPQNGQKKENVEAQYGVPLERIGAVGEPPISRWVYQDFTVYFEHDIVLHAVLHKS